MLICKNVSRLCLYITTKHYLCDVLLTLNIDYAPSDKRAIQKKRKSAFVKNCGKKYIFL